MTSSPSTPGLSGLPLSSASDVSPSVSAQDNVAVSSESVVSAMPVVPHAPRSTSMFDVLPSGLVGDHGIFRCGRFRFSLAQPLVMGILNVTPDSFSDGGKYQMRDAALRRAEAMIREGAHILDIGGESTRPGALEVSLGEELDRVLPVVEALRDFGVALSIDTYKPDVMRAALEAGADMINDIRAFTEDGALEVVARNQCGVCAMHMQGAPTTMQDAPSYEDVVDEVRHFLERRVIALESSGVARERIVVDPGFGFGKSVAHNFRLLRDLPMTSPGGLPILAGMSRKSMLAAVIPSQEGEVPPASRVIASVAAAVCAAERGAAIIRVHDVAQTVEALSVWSAIGQDDPAAPQPRGAIVEMADGRAVDADGTASERADAVEGMADAIVPGGDDATPERRGD
ncbi:dihydropteroate synthase [Robbsia andropogonis]